jgi:hypothetical protein
MEPLNLMLSLSFFGNKRDRADIASNRARRRSADAESGPAPASKRARQTVGARQSVGARRVVRWLRTVGAR